MEPAITGHEAVDHNELYSTPGGWHSSSGSASRGCWPEIHADHLDRHQIARLVQCGRPPQLALRIVS